MLCGLRYNGPKGSFHLLLSTFLNPEGTWPPGTGGMEAGGERDRQAASTMQSFRFLFQHQICPKCLKEDSRPRSWSSGCQPLLTSRLCPVPPSCHLSFPPESTPPLLPEGSWQLPPCISDCPPRPRCCGLKGLQGGARPRTSLLPSVSRERACE